jgi:Phosphopantothenoylcysteine synthetase/decarboxylase
MSGIRRDQFYLRDPASVTVGARDSFLFSSAATRSVLTTEHPAALSHLLQRLGSPTAGGDVLDSAQPGLVEVVESLVADGFVLAAGTPERLEAARDQTFRDNRGYSFEPGPAGCGHLVLAMTGSIIAGLMAPYVLSLAYSGFQQKLDLVFTTAALSFVQPEMFEYYGIRTWSDAFARRDGVTVPHIALGKSADLVLVMPASARSMARLAAGECSDLLSLIVAATRAPVVVAPTLNTLMWDHPGVRRNVDVLRADGVYVMEPTVFLFEAAELNARPQPGVGMAGTFWGGPASLMKVLSEVLELHRGLPAG